MEDNGPGLPGTVKYGIGLTNTLQRLKQLYSRESKFELKNKSDGDYLLW